MRAGLDQALQRLLREVETLFHNDRWTGLTLRRLAPGLMCMLFVRYRAVECEQCPGQAPRARSRRALQPSLG